MGTFDLFEGLKCPTCGVDLWNAQTKGGPRLFDVLKPGCVYKAHKIKGNDYYNESNRMTAYGRCPRCHVMWDVEIVLIRVNGMVVVSPEVDKYVYREATWATKWSEDECEE